MCIRLAIIELCKENAELNGITNHEAFAVDTFDYLPYAFFNLLSPVMTLIFAAFNIKIKQLVSDIKE